MENEGIKFVCGMICCFIGIFLFCSLGANGYYQISWLFLTAFFYGLCLIFQSLKGGIKMGRPKKVVEEDEEEETEYEEEDTDLDD